MSYSGTPTTYGEQQIAAAAATGKALSVVTVAVGDGGGSPVAPVEGQTALTHEVWRGAISSWGVDPADTRRIVVSVTVPATAGPFTVREAGVFDASGGLICVTALAATEVVGPGMSNQATSIDLIIAMPIGSAGAIAVSPTQGERFTIERLWRTPFISINSASTTVPPATPAVGDLYIVPAGASGAWATAAAGTIAEWNGIFWAFLAPPLKMVAGIMDVADDGASEYLKWDGIGWEPFAGAGCIYTVTDNGSSTPDEFVGTVSPGLVALQPNMLFRFRQGAQSNQTVAPKANLLNSAGNALGDKPFAKADTTSLAIGDLPAKVDFLADWDGTQFRVFGLRPADVVQTVVQTVVPYIRPRAQANLTLFVSSSASPVTSSGYTFGPGSDSNNGLTPGSPFLTPQKAWTYLLTLDLAGYTAAIQFADGVYAGAGLNASGVIQGANGPVLVLGNAMAPANVVIAHNQTGSAFANAGAIVANAGAQLSINGIKVSSTNFNGIVSNNAGSNVSYQNVVFGACAGAHALAENLGFTFMNAGSYTIAGGATAHFATQGGGQIYNNGVTTIALSGTPAFSQGFVQGNSGLTQLGMTFTGTATGPRYSLTDGAVIVLNGIAETSIPGSSNGICTKGFVDGGIGADWTAYSVGLAAATGSISGVAQGYWKRIDKAVLWTVSISVSAASGGCSVVTVTAPPLTPNNVASGGGRENGSTGKGVAAGLSSGATSITVNLSDVSALAAGMLLVASGTYPIAA